MYRKALIAIAVGSIVGAAAQAAGEQPVAISSPDSQTPPVNCDGREWTADHTSNFGSDLG